MRSSYKGKYQVKNSSKYKGNLKMITFRSSWELKFLKWCDENPDVISFSSEEIVIPYLSPMDNQYHRYFVDFWVKFKNGQQILIEIKPDTQTKPPKIPKKINESYMESLMTWEKNNAKWRAAMEYAKKNDMIFKVWTEKSLGKLGIKI